MDYSVQMFQFDKRNTKLSRTEFEFEVPSLSCLDAQEINA